MTYLTYIQRLQSLFCIDNSMQSKINKMNKTQSSSSSNWVEKDRRIWVKAQSNYTNPYQDAFLEGVVQNHSQKDARVLLVDSKEQHSTHLENILKLTYGPKDVADMVDLEELNEPELLYNIKRRYLDDMVFTYCGPTLLIINPYVKIEKLFNDSVLHEYQSLVFTDTLQYKSLSPHIFGLAAFCLWQLFDNERNQSIVISGESGAGKTENTKYCLKFLASLGKNMKELTSESREKKSKMNHNLKAAQRAIKKTSSKVFGIEEKILGCNQILEAFGNAKTIRNDNSSRFGKLILLVYGQTQIQIKSAFIISYLLEKSRIVSVSEGQRNYHIFYYFCKGTSAEQKQKYMLKPKTSDYYYLNQSTVTSIPGTTDEEHFAQIQKEFKHYLSTDEIQAVLTILSIVLNVGNLQFKKEENKSNEEIAVIKNAEFLQTVSKLLQVDYEAVEHCFKFKTRKMGVSVINSPLKYDEAVSLRDSFAKNIYEKTFNFLIQRLNEKIQIEPINISENGSYRKSIGLLDIFGFEVLTINSLEQFFINFANEKLQQLYVSYIFKEQQNQFMKEGLKQHTSDIGFQDNKPIIDLFENRPLGIFHLINQSSELNQNDADMPDSIAKNHNKNEFLKIPKSKRSAFEIIHSCSPVTYNTNGFTVKNKDQFPQQLLNVIHSSKNNALKMICVGEEKQPEQKSGGKASKKFLGSKFLNEMNKLIDELYSCDCHFVRCIKPNSKKSPKLFNSHAVLQSLRYLGVLDSIIIRKLGYIYRRPFKEFYKKFYELDKYIFSYKEDTKGMTEDDYKKESKKIIDKYAKKEFENNFILFGHKKILIKESTLNHLESLVKEKRKSRINAANRFNLMYKNAVFRTKVRIMMKSLKVLKTHMKLLASDIKEKIMNDKIIKIQNVVKKFLWQKRLEKIKEQATKSVTKISAYYKMKRQRKIFLETRQKSIRLQACVRSYLAMGKFFRFKTCNEVTIGFFEQSWHMIENAKATLIQKVYKGYRTRKQYKEAIEIMKKNIALSKIRAKFKRALFQHRYNKFKQALDRYRKPVIKLQAIVRGRYIHRTYQKVLKSTLLIQKVYRRHLKKRFYLQKHWKQYRKIMSQNEGKKIEQMMTMGIYIPENRKLRNIEQTTGMKVCISPSEMIIRYGLQQISPQIESHKYADWSINSTIDFSDKNTFQLYIADYDCISSEQYGGQWIRQYIKIKNQLYRRSEYPLQILHNEHITAITSNKDRIWSWSSKINQIHQIDKIGHIVTAKPIKEKIYAFNQQEEVYQWGSSQESFGERKLLKDHTQKKIKSVELGNQSQEVFLLSNEGMVYRQEYNNYEKKTSQKILKFPQRVQIKSIASSGHCTHFLSNTGLLYSMGKNQRGELGLGFKSKEVLEPTINNELKKIKESIETISIGKGHSVAKSKLGYVYTWGGNSFGQTGHKGPNSIKPIRLQLQERPIKVYQAVAGLRATYLLQENLKILAYGCSYTFETKNSGWPRQINYFQESNSNSKNLTILKISCTWTNEQSILSVNCLDVTQCKPGTKPEAINKYCKNIAKEWVENTAFPQYHQWMDNALNLSDMRKLKFKKNVSPTKKTKKTNQKTSRLEELKMLVELRKTSSMFREAAKTKIEEFMSSIEKKSQEKWTDEEQEIAKYIMQEYKGHK